MSKRDTALNPNHPKRNPYEHLDKVLTLKARDRKPKVRSWLSVVSGMSQRMYVCNVCGKTIDVESALWPQTKHAISSVAEHRLDHTNELAEDIHE
jgi:hypothetical protein